MTSVQERVAADIAEGKRRAAERWAEMTPEEQAKATALVESFPSLLARAYIGPENSKGRAQLYILPEGETP
jgi:hypothetical protein